MLIHFYKKSNNMQCFFTVHALLYTSTASLVDYVCACNVVINFGTNTKIQFVQISVEFRTHFITLGKYIW